MARLREDLMQSSSQEPASQSFIDSRMTERMPCLAFWKLQTGFGEGRSKG